ncbi:unnamed protein product [Parnassius mnemosyne]
MRLLAMFDEHGQQLECPSLPLGPAPSTEPAQVNPPLPVSPSFSRNVRPEVVVVVERLDEENGNEYLLAEVYHEEVVASSSGGAVRGVWFPVTAAAGGRQARGGRCGRRGCRARGARVSDSSSCHIILIIFCI